MHRLRLGASEREVGDQGGGDHVTNLEGHGTEVWRVHSCSFPSACHPSPPQAESASPPHPELLGPGRGRRSLRAEEPDLGPVKSGAVTALGCLGTHSLPWVSRHFGRQKVPRGEALALESGSRVQLHGLCLSRGVPAGKAELISPLQACAAVNLPEVHSLTIDVYVHTAVREEGGGRDREIETTMMRGNH